MMKKTFILLLALVSIVAFPESASAQFDLSKALGSLLGGSSKSTTTTTTNDPYKKLAEAAPAASTLNGTWSYDSATFTYLGNNPLADVVVAQLDPIIADVMRQLGVTRGSAELSMQSGEGVVSHGDSEIRGKYTYQRSTAAITVSTTYEGKSVSVSGYVKYGSNMLTVLLDVKQLVKAVKTVYPELKSDQNIVLMDSLLKDMTGVYAVGKFKRK